MDNEVDKFLEGLNNEPKDDPFKSEAEDPFAQPAKEEEKEEEVKDEKPLPFHKDPKVQKFIDKEISKRMAENKPSETEQFVRETKSEDDPLTDVLNRIVGNDTPEKLSAIKDFKKALESRDERVKESALRELQAQGQEERQAEADARAELEEGFENIEEEFGVDITSNVPVAKKTRGEFVDFIKLIAPKDSDGQVREYPDLTESFKLFQGMKKQSVQPSRAKELASRSMSRSSDASMAQKPTDNSWSAVEKLFAKHQ